MLYTFTYWRVSWGTQTGKGNALAIILYTSCTIFTLTWYRIFLGKDQLNNLDTAAAAKSLQSCPTLCDPIDGRPPGSPVPGTLQTRTLEWVAISFSSAWKWKGNVKTLSHVGLSDPRDRSPPGSSVHGIFQARVLEWGAISFSWSQTTHV